MRAYLMVAGGVVTMRTMVYRAYVKITFEVENGLMMLCTNINGHICGFRLNLSFNKYTRNFNFYVVTHVF